MRSFIRHPSEIPIEIYPDHSPESSPDMLINISHGGLSFHSQAGILPGTIVNLTMHIPDGNKQVRAGVVWCRDIPEGYDMGVEFLSAIDSYTVRMVEQVCHIEHYRRKVKEEQGREIDSEQAAMEWIAQNASDFPQSD
jgi:hypothetical protein